MQQPNTEPAGETTVLAEIQVVLASQGGRTGVLVNSSADLFTSIGLLEMAKDSLKQQAAQPPPSPLVVARAQPLIKRP